MSQMELLYTEFYQRLYLYALTFLDTEEEARDVVSEVFSAVWQQWVQAADADWRVPGLAYLYKATRNQCLDYLRHARAKERFQQLSATADVFDNEAEVAAYEERIGKLHQAIGRLPEPEQSIVRECCLNRLSYKQAAEVLGLSEAIVHRRIMKAYRLLREWVKTA